MTQTYNGYRMKCGDVDAEPTATNGRRMATSGRPVLCGTELNRILGKARPANQAPRSDWFGRVAARPRRPVGMIGRAATGPAPHIRGPGPGWTRLRCRPGS